MLKGGKKNGMDTFDIKNRLNKIPHIPKNIEVRYFDVIESTSTAAKSDAGRAECDVLYVARRQTAGRGRLGRSFISPEGGLYMSFLFCGERRAEDALKMTVYAAVCVARAIEALTGLDVKIKWVNDLFLGEKKLAGILCEGVFDTRGGICAAVLGIGVNLVGDLGLEIKDIATTLSEHTECVPSAEELLVKIVEELYSLSGERFADVLCEYRRRSCVIGKRVKVLKADSEYYATATDIDEAGRLVLQKEDGSCEHLMTGEVSVRLT